VVPPAAQLGPCPSAPLIRAPGMPQLQMGHEQVPTACPTCCTSVPRAQTSVVMSTLVVSDRNSAIKASPQHVLHYRRVIYDL